MEPDRPIRKNVRRDGLPNSERAYRQLRQAIVSGELQPNTRLIEAEVAARIGVSRTPVREALNRLLSDGLVSRDKLGGLVVHAASTGEIEEVYLVREVLDGLAARLAAHRLSPDDLIKLHVIHRRMEAAANGRAKELVGVNIAFHDAIYQIAHNRRLTQMAQELRDFVRRFSREAFGVQERLAAVVREHAAIIAALESRDADAAETAARHHMREARAHMMRAHLAEELSATLG